MLAIVLQHVGPLTASCGLAIITFFFEPMMRESLLICIIIALTGTGCGGSSDSVNQPLAPTTVPAGQRPPLALTVNGRKLLSAIGDTSQLTAIATWPDGTARDVTAEVRWNSHQPSVATVSSSGLATAVGFGAARIDAGYGSLNNTFQIGVTPAGTFAVTGRGARARAGGS